MVAPYYQDSYCTIYHCDCREVLPQLDKVDLLLTDPPYGLGGKLKGGSGRWQKHFSGAAPTWDKTISPELIGALDKATLQIVWGGQFYPLPVGRCWLIWNKIIRNWSGSECELAWTNLDKPNRAFDYSHGQLASEGKDYHPTQKPLPLMAWCIALAGDVKTILDPFMGSGTTLRAAKDLQRKAIGIELDERYCEIAAKRLRQEVLLLGNSLSRPNPPPDSPNAAQTTEPPSEDCRYKDRRWWAG